MIYPLQIGVLVLLVFNVNKGLCVKCYICSSLDSEECIKPDKSKVPMLPCNLDAMKQTQMYAEKINKAYHNIFEVDGHDMERNLDLNCLKQISKAGNKQYIIRGCQLAEQNNLDICKKLRDANTDIYKTIHCSRCSADGCNSANVENYSITVVLSAICASLLWQAFSN